MRAAIFEKYGLFFDDKKEDTFVPFGMNLTESKLIPPMVSSDGEVKLASILRQNLARSGKPALSVNCLVCHTSIVPSPVDGVPQISWATPNVFHRSSKTARRLCSRPSRA